MVTLEEVEVDTEVEIAAVGPLGSSVAVVSLRQDLIAGALMALVVVTVEGVVSSLVGLRKVKRTL